MLNGWIVLVKAKADDKRALMRADVAFIGTNALTLDHGLSTADSQEAAIKSAMITNAHKVVVLCDSTKMGTDYLVSFGSISEIDVIVTEKGIVERPDTAKLAKLMCRKRLH